MAVGTLSLTIPTVAFASEGSGSGGLLALTIPTVSVAIAGGGGLFGSLTLTIPVSSIRLWGAGERLTFAIPTAGIIITGTHGGKLVCEIPTVQFRGHGSILPHGALSILLPTISAFLSGGRIPSTYRVASLNIRNFANTEYEGFNFNSLAEHQGLFWGADANGIYLLGGTSDDDEAIDMEISPGWIDCMVNTERGIVQVFPRLAWLTHGSGGELVLEVEMDERITGIYKILNVRESIYESGIPLGRGLRGRFMKLTIRNLRGADPRLQSVRIVGEGSHRRRR